MSIICSICNRKQSGWYEDFPVSDSLLQYRVCGACHDSLTALTKEEINKEKAEEAIHYLEPFAFNI